MAFVRFGFGFLLMEIFEIMLTVGLQQRPPHARIIYFCAFSLWQLNIKGKTIGKVVKVLLSKGTAGKNSVFLLR